MAVLLWQELLVQRSLDGMNRSMSEKITPWSWIVAPSSTLAAALLGSFLCWLAFPPVAWGALVWVAPVPWLMLVVLPQLPGKRPYRALWLAGVIFWLLTVHWIRLPHPANYLSLLVLACYLGIYLPLFVGLSRRAVHLMRVPLWLAAPITWTGLDWLRHHLMTGFGMGSLAHTQVEYPAIIQIADIFGEYGVTFLIVLVASCLTTVLSNCEPRRPRPRFWRLLPAAISLLAALVYGSVSFMEHHSVISQMNRPSGPRIALIQGNTLADWKSDLEKQSQIVAEYVQLSQDAVRESLKRDGRKVDLVIWPETSFRQPLVTVEEGYAPPKDRVHPTYITGGQSQLAELVKLLDAAVLVGIDRVHIFPDDEGQPDYNSYNSSVLVDSQGVVLGTYDKMHRVPFGEYIPFAEWFPSLYEFTPLTGGIDAGQGPGKNLWLGDFLIAPNICYETAVPQLIRRQVHEASDRANPNVMVNLTNDAWYWGSSELDMHLACGVFRAVEMRVPLVVAANGGLSASIDAYGTIWQVTQRQQPSFLLVDLNRTYASSSYLMFGDWFAILCVLCCMVFTISSRVATQRTAPRVSRGDTAE